METTAWRRGEQTRRQQISAVSSVI